MPWERRYRQLVHYRAQKVGGRVIRTYFGAGETAERAYAEDQSRRAERDRQAEGAHAVRRLHTGATASLGELTELTDLLTKATLFGLGFHLHDRVWRRRRAPHHK